MSALESLATVRWTEIPIEQLVDLLQVSLGGGQRRSREFFEWKHASAHFGRSLGLVATDDGVPVGVRMFVRWRWRAGGKVWPAVRAVDTATHPDWRRRGLFRGLTERLVEDVRSEGAAFVFNTPNRQSRAGYLKMGWRALGRVPIMVRPWFGTRGRLPSVSIDSGTSGLPDVGALLDDSKLNAFLCSVRQNETRLHTPLDVDYLRWRYADIPGHSYRALWDVDLHRGAVVIARSRTRGTRRELLFAEVIAAADPGSIANAAVRVRRMMAALDCHYALGCGASGTPERRALSKAGFFPALPVGPHFVFRSLIQDPGLESAARFRSWRLSLGDLEVF